MKDLRVKLATQSLKTGLTAELIKYTYVVVQFQKTIINQVI